MPPLVHSLYQLTNLYQGRNGVLILKQYLNGRWVALSIFLALLAGFSIPFNTWSYSEFFALMGRRQPNRVWPEIFAIAGIVILFALIEYAYQRALNRNVAIFNQKVREHLLTADFIQTNQAGVADRLSYLINDLTVVENNYLRQIFNIIRSVVTVVVTLAFALRSNFGLTLIFIAFAGITPFTPKLLAKKTAHRAQQWSARVGRYMTFMADVLKNADTVLHYSALGFFLAKGRSIIGQSVTAQRRRDNTVAASNLVATVVAYVCMYLPIGFGVMMVVRGQLTIAAFVAVQYASNWIVNTFLGIAQSRNQMNATRPMLAKLAAFKALPANLLRLDQPTDRLGQFTALNLAAVTFAYADDAAQPILQTINLRVHQGEKVLLTGPSGAGKSTLISLLTGMRQPMSGTVQFQTAAGKAFAPDPTMFATVLQESNIFNDTLRFNLTLGRHFSSAAIQAALQKAGLAAYAADHGLDNLIAESGNNLSGGERKRIELARAFLYNRRFLVVDEGTASLDPATAAAIQQILLTAPMTVVEIDHHIAPDLSRRFDAHYALNAGQLTRVTA